MRLTDRIKQAFTNYPRPAFRLPRREEGELTLFIRAGYTRQELGKALRELSDEFSNPNVHIANDVSGYVVGGRWALGADR